MSLAFSERVLTCLKRFHRRGRAAPALKIRHGQRYPTVRLWVWGLQNESLHRLYSQASIFCPEVFDERSNPVSVE